MRGRVVGGTTEEVAGDDVIAGVTHFRSNAGFLVVDVALVSDAGGRGRWRGGRGCSGCCRCCRS